MSVFHAANATGGRCDNSSALREEDSTYKDNGCFMRFHRYNIKETYVRIIFNTEKNKREINLKSQLFMVTTGNVLLEVSSQIPLNVYNVSKFTFLCQILVLLKNIVL